MSYDSNVVFGREQRRFVMFAIEEHLYRYENRNEAFAEPRQVLRADHHTRENRGQAQVIEDVARQHRERQALIAAFRKGLSKRLAAASELDMSPRTDSRGRISFVVATHLKLPH